MAIVAYLGDTVRVKAYFGEELPEEVTVHAVDPDNSVIVSPGAATDVDDDGNFIFEWVAETLGRVTFVFEATFADSTSATQEILVWIEENPASTHENALGTDYELTFAGEVAPSFLEATDMILEGFDIDPVSVLDIVHRYSLEVEKLGFADVESQFLVIEYLQAATLCELIRRFNPIMGGTESTLRLGDLSYTTRSVPGRDLNRGNASSWCEYAMVLRRELTQANSKRFVRSGRRKNPMPDRGLGRAHRWWPGTHHD